jgi:RNA polymerase sigma-70 factor (ECF subfamily)
VPDVQSQQRFADLTDPFRRELTVHCYRLLGSFQDAEDMVQETYLRAWRGFESFEGRSTVRTWMYRIATNTCLNALESRKTRALPSQLAAPSQGVDLADQLHENLWIEPLPDTLLEPSAETVTMDRSSTRLAMVAALQTLSARERACVVLHDVVKLTSAEVAEALDTTTAAVNSALQRARGRLAEAGPREDEIVEPTTQALKATLDAYVEALSTANIAALARLFRQDVTLEMPPIPTWFSGAADVEAFFYRRVSRPGEWRMLATSANGQPAAAGYRRNRDGVLTAHSLNVLTITTTGIVRIVAFRRPGLLVPFGLPDHLPG